jgi:hypothetical protein
LEIEKWQPIGRKKTRKEYGHGDQGNKRFKKEVANHVNSAERSRKT